MKTTIRSILGAVIMATGSLVAVVAIENQAYADGLGCTNTGCAARSGLGTRDCSASDGSVPCASGPGVQCSCKEVPFSTEGCYCHATIS
jgi:hypothetical protein